MSASVHAAKSAVDFDPDAMWVPVAKPGPASQVPTAKPNVTSSTIGSGAPGAAPRTLQDHIASYDAAIEAVLKDLAGGAGSASFSSLDGTALGLNRTARDGPSVVPLSTAQQEMSSAPPPASAIPPSSSAAAAAAARGADWAKLMLETPSFFASAAAAPGTTAADASASPTSASSPPTSQARRFPAGPGGQAFPARASAELPAAASTRVQPSQASPTWMEVPLPPRSGLAEAAGAAPPPPPPPPPPPRAATAGFAAATAQRQGAAAVPPPPPPEQQPQRSAYRFQYAASSDSSAGGYHTETEEEDEEDEQHEFGAPDNNGEWGIDDLDDAQLQKLLAAAVRRHHSDPRHGHGMGPEDELEGDSDDAVDEEEDEEEVEEDDEPELLPQRRPQQSHANVKSVGAASSGLADGDDASDGDEGHMPDAHDVERCFHQLRLEQRVAGELVEALNRGPAGGPFGNTTFQRLNAEYDRARRQREALVAQEALQLGREQETRFQQDEVWPKEEQARVGALGEMLQRALECEHAHFERYRAIEDRIISKQRAMLRKSTELQRLRRIAEDCDRQLDSQDAYLQRRSATLLAQETELAKARAAADAEKSRIAERREAVEKRERGIDEWVLALERKENHLAEQELHVRALGDDFLRREEAVRCAPKENQQPAHQGVTKSSGDSGGAMKKPPGLQPQTSSAPAVPLAPAASLREELDRDDDDSDG